jgi:hypothetical protein
MSAQQQNLKNNLDAITNALSAYGNVNLAVITTSMSSSTYTTTPGGGKFVGPVLNTSQKDFMIPFQSEIMVGTGGDAEEKPLEALSSALSPALLSGVNSGFLRPNADLIIVFVTDTEDQSLVVTPPAVWAQLQALKPHNAIKTIGALVLDPKTCNADQFGTGTPLKDFINLSGGVIVDLCGDFSQTIPSALGELGQVDNVYTLQVLPGTEISTKSIQVTVGQDTLVAGDAIHGWVFDSSTNTLTIGSDVLAHTNATKMVISYSLVNK